MELIYHYTKLSTLLALYDGMKKGIECATTDEERNTPKLILRASNIHFLNDTQENQMLPHVLRNLGISEEQLCTIEKETGQHYAFSFSIHQDKLSMWQRYANNGNGIALGFDKKNIISTVENSSLAIDVADNCEYTTCSKLKTLIEQQPLYQLYKTNPQTLKPLLALYSQSLKYKHESFKDEGEFRIAFSEYHEEKYYATNTAIIPYQEIMVPVESLKEIVVGPCLDYEKTKYSILRMQMYYLENFPYKRLNNDSIIKSSIPFVNQ